MAPLFQLWNVMLSLSPRMVPWSVLMLLLENSPTSPHVPFNATGALIYMDRLNLNAHPRDCGPRRCPPAKVLLSSDSQGAHQLSCFMVRFSWFLPWICHLQWYSVQPLKFQERWTWAAAGQQFLAPYVNLHVPMDGHWMDLQFWRVVPQDTGLGCCLRVKVMHWLAVVAWESRLQKGCCIAKETNCPLCQNQIGRL